MPSSAPRRAGVDGQNYAATASPAKYSRPAARRRLSAAPPTSGRRGRHLTTPSSPALPHRRHGQRTARCRRLHPCFGAGGAFRRSPLPFRRLFESRAVRLPACSSRPRPPGPPLPHGAPASRVHASTQARLDSCASRRFERAGVLSPAALRPCLHRDGRVDLYVTRLDRPCILFRNQGDGTSPTSPRGRPRRGRLQQTAPLGRPRNDRRPRLYSPPSAWTRIAPLFVNDGQCHFPGAVARAPPSRDGPPLGAALCAPTDRAGARRPRHRVAADDYNRDRSLDTLLLRTAVPRVPATSSTSLTPRASPSTASRPDGSECTLASPPASRVYADCWPDLLVAADYCTSRSTATTRGTFPTAPRRLTSARRDAGLGDWRL